MVAPLSSRARADAVADALLLSSESDAEPYADWPVGPMPKKTSRPLPRRAAKRRSLLPSDDCRNPASRLPTELKLKILQYAAILRGPAGGECARAAAAGSVEALAFARVHIGAPWGSQTCLNAVASGSIAALGYAAGRGCPFDERAVNLAAFRGRLDMLACMRGLAEGPGAGADPFDGACAHAAAGGSVDALKLLRELGCGLSAEVMNRAVAHGREDAVRYLIAAGCPVNKSACYLAADRGLVAIMEQLADAGAPLTSAAIEAAASSGHMDVARLLVARGCPGGATACNKAALCGHHEMFVFLHASGFPLDTVSPAAAFVGGNAAIMVYLHERGLWEGGLTLAMAMESGRICGIEL